MDNMTQFIKLCGLTTIIMTLLMINTVDAAKKSVAIMPLENLSGYEEQRVAEIMTEQLSVTIQNSGSYTVVERTQLNKVIKEQGFQSVSADPKSAVETGKLTGAQYSIIGKVTMANISSDDVTRIAKRLGFGVKFSNPYKGKIALNFRIVDNQTGEVIFTTTVEGSKSGDSKELALYGACKEAAQNAFKEIQKINPFVARIEDISGDDIYIDQGSDSGITKGEILIIARESSPIVIKGKVVGMKQTTIGKAKVIEIYPEYSICRIVSTSKNVKKGDIVKRES